VATMAERSSLRSTADTVCPAHAVGDRGQRLLGVCATPGWPAIDGDHTCSTCVWKA
jgi:hypothetical protein